MKLKKIYKPIAAEKVNKNNSNLWQHSAELTKELRKFRWKKTDPEKMDKFINPSGQTWGGYRTNKEYKDVYGAESAGYDPYQDPVERYNFGFPQDVNFKKDIYNTARLFMSEREAIVCKAWLFGGLNQQETAAAMGCSQASVSILRNNVKSILKWHYFDK